MAPRGTHMMPPARCVGERVDWIAIGFRVELDRDVMGAVREGLRKAATHGRAGVVLEREREQWRAECRAKGARGALLTSFGGAVRVVVDAGAPGKELVGGVEVPGWTVSIEVSGPWLVREGWRRAVDEAHRIARVFGEVKCARLRRLDQCADFVSFPIRAEDVDVMVKRSKAKPLRYYDFGDGWRARRDEVELEEGGAAVHGNGRAVCGLVVGRSAVMCRIYDKTYELRCRRDDDKRAAEEDVWRSNGWRSDDAVTRVEFQLRGEALEEMGCRGASVAEIATYLDSIWRYCTGELRQGKETGWLRLVVPMRSRRARCPTDARWTAVRSVVWARAGRPSVSRRRRSTGARSAQAFGCALSLLAAAGELPPVPRMVTGDGQILDEEEAAKTMPPTDAAWTVRMACAAVFARAARVVADDVLAKREDPREAAAHVLVRWQAAASRFAPAKALPRHATWGRARGLLAAAPREKRDLFDVKAEARDGTEARVCSDGSGEAA